MPPPVAWRSAADDRFPLEDRAGPQASPARAGSIIRTMPGAAYRRRASLVRGGVRAYSTSFAETADAVAMSLGVSCVEAAL